MTGNADNRTAPEERLFFGLALPGAARDSLQATCKQLVLPSTARPSLPQNYHLTLVFLGQVSARQLPCVKHAAGHVRSQELQLRLDNLGHWPRPQVLWAAPSAPPEALQHLVDALQQQLHLCGFKPEQRRYRPHVTLARRLRSFNGPTELEAITWHARQFHLYRSSPTPDGVRYHPIHTWPLSAN